MTDAESGAVRAESGRPCAEPNPPGAESGAAGAFAEELKAHRLRVGWTQVQLGERIGYSGSLISDIERGTRNATLDFAQRCDTEMGAPGTFERLYGLTRREAFPSWFAPVIPFETAASKISSWEVGSVPGLLQTADYARSVIRARWPQADDDYIERTVTARVERQAILTGRRPPLVWCVLHEGLLRHVIGGPAIMSEQLGKLAELACGPGIVLQVLPYTAHDHAGVEGPISIYESSSFSSVAYSECYGGGRLVEAPDEVADLQTVMALLRAAALSPRDSLALVRAIRRDIDG